MERGRVTGNLNVDVSCTYVAQFTGASEINFVLFADYRKVL